MARVPREPGPQARRSCRLPRRSPRIAKKNQSAAKEKGKEKEKEKEKQKEKQKEKEKEDILKELLECGWKRMENIVTTRAVCSGRVVIGQVSVTDSLIFEGNFVVIKGLKCDGLFAFGGTLDLWCVLSSPLPLPFSLCLPYSTFTQAQPFIFFNDFLPTYPPGHG